jgi:hypothetical protein
VEGLVGQEEIQGLDDLLHDHARALDVVQADLDLAGPVEDVGGAPGGGQGAEHGATEQEDQNDGRNVGPGARGDVRQARVDGMPGEDADPQTHAHHGQRPPKPGDPSPPAPLSGAGHIGARPEQLLLAQHRPRAEVQHLTTESVHSRPR